MQVIARRGWHMARARHRALILTKDAFPRAYLMVQEPMPGWMDGFMKESGAKVCVMEKEP